MNERMLLGVAALAASTALIAPTIVQAEQPDRKQIAAHLVQPDQQAASNLDKATARRA